jgi:hypothetical protein
MKFLILLFPLTAAATPSGISDKTMIEFLEMGGPAKALAHLQCILTHQTQTKFALTKSNVPRCNGVENGFVSVHNQNYAVLVDYTVPSDERRLYLLPIGQNSASIERHFVSHGRNGNTPRDNTIEGGNRNTILNVHYFSNDHDSNASSTGFFITGRRYIGENHGHDRKHPLPSMALYGVEPGVNDNVCGRSVVVHGNDDIADSGPHAGMHRMSSGCFMLDYKYVEEFITIVEGSASEGGAAMFAYGPREASLPNDFYCH